MSRTARVAVRAVLVGAATAAAVVVTPGLAQADTCVDSGTGAPLALDAPPCADVLAQEARWLTAITAGDVTAVESILGPTFRHVTADGEPLDRAQEIAAMKPLPVTFDASDQIVDVYGDTAVIHGINTVTERGMVVAGERFIDVFLLQNGVWKALAAQETAVQN
ncbi:MAG: hypothetical protein QOH27_4657 [Mycobacterium sp.]|nr:hypothetical protein [Mycobacterium sp.]